VEDEDEFMFVAVNLGESFIEYALLIRDDVFSDALDDGLFVFVYDVECIFLFVLRDTDIDMEELFGVRVVVFDVVRFMFL
jgi:hypothetical protein